MECLHYEMNHKGSVICPHLDTYYGTCELNEDYPSIFPEIECPLKGDFLDG